MTSEADIYLAIGATMQAFAFDAGTLSLALTGSITLPSRVRFAVAHPHLPIVYAGCGPGEQPNMLVAIARDAHGQLHLVGEPVQLTARPMELTIAPSGRHLVVVYDTDPGITLHLLEPDGRIGAPVPRAEPFETGYKSHSATILPEDGKGFLVALGQRGFGSPKYVDGRIIAFRFDDSELASASSMVPTNALDTGGFNPRNVALHPHLPLALVSIEGQNTLGVFRCEGLGLASEPAFLVSSLAHPDDLRKRQNLGAILIHPQGHVVYLANRNDGYLGGHQQASWRNPDPIPVWPGGENNIAVFALDARTGEPRLVQHIDTHGIHPRTISMDPTGRVLMAGNCAPTRFETAAGIEDVPASLVFYEIQPDGTLRLALRHSIEVGEEKMWWSQIVPRPTATYSPVIATAEEAR